MVLRRGSNVTLVAAAAVIVGAGVKLAAPLLNPFLLAVFLTVMTAPLVMALHRRGLPRWLAVLAGVLVDLAVMAGLATFVGGSIGAFGEKVPRYELRFTQVLASAHDTLLLLGIDVSTNSLRDVADPAALVDMLRQLAQSLATLVSKLFMVLMLVAFMLFESTALEGKLRRVLEDQQDLRDLADGITEIKSYLVVKTLTSAGTGVVLGGWCAFMGVDLPWLWGLLAFLLNYIPNVGAIIAAVPPVALSLVQFGPAGAFAVASGYTVANISIGVIEPRLMGRALGLSALVVFLSMIVWGWLLGPVGALFSAPLTLVFKHWCEHTNDFAWIAVLLSPSDEVPADQSTPGADAPLVREASLEPKPSE